VLCRVGGQGYEYGHRPAAHWRQSPVAEDLVADGKSDDGWANLLDDARRIETRYQGKYVIHERRQNSQHYQQVGRGKTSSLHADQHFVVFKRGLR